MFFFFGLVFPPQSCHICWCRFCFYDTDRYFIFNIEMILITIFFLPHITSTSIYTYLMFSTILFNPILEQCFNSSYPYFQDLISVRIMVTVTGLNGLKCRPWVLCKKISTFYPISRCNMYKVLGLGFSGIHGKGGGSVLTVINAHAKVLWSIHSMLFFGHSHSLSA